MRFLLLIANIFVLLQTCGASSYFLWSNMDFFKSSKQIYSHSLSSQQIEDALFHPTKVSKLNPLFGENHVRPFLKKLFTTGKFFEPSSSCRSFGCLFPPIVYCNEPRYIPNRSCKKQKKKQKNDQLWCAFFFLLTIIVVGKFGLELIILIAFVFFLFRLCSHLLKSRKHRPS